MQINVNVKKKRMLVNVDNVLHYVKTIITIILQHHQDVETLDVRVKEIVYFMFEKMHQMLMPIINEIGILEDKI